MKKHCQSERKQAGVERRLRDEANGSGRVRLTHPDYQRITIPPCQQRIVHPRCQEYRC